MMAVLADSERRGVTHGAPIVSRETSGAMTAEFERIVVWLAGAPQGWYNIGVSPSVGP